MAGCYRAVGLDDMGVSRADGLSFWLLAIAVIIYFVPLFVASIRNHPNAVAISLLNLFLGWTLIGWVGALVWASLANKPRST